jgi:hypothetical protein
MHTDAADPRMFRKRAEPPAAPAAQEAKKTKNKKK